MKNFALHKMGTSNSSAKDQTRNINHEDTVTESDESKLVDRSEAIKIGVADIETGENSMISPIPKFGCNYNSNLTMPSASKIVDDSFG